jgi:hypothetical protein
MTASNLARILAISVLLAALSLGGIANAQESDDPPAPGGVTQPDPQPDPGTEPTPDPEPAPDPQPDPDPEPTPDPEPSPTPETQPDSEKPDPSDGIPDSWSEPVGPTRVRVSPQAGGPGTVVTMVADIQGSCDTGISFFQDRKQIRTNESTRTTSGSYDMKANRVVARYTISSKDAVGRGRFAMSCDMRLDTYRVGYAKFRVLGSDGAVAKNTTDRNDRTQVPNRIDTGLGGTADDGGPGGFGPTRLLLPAGLLLIVVSAGLGLRQAARSRR